MYKQMPSATSASCSFRVRWTRSNSQGTVWRGASRMVHDVQVPSSCQSPAMARVTCKSQSLVGVHRTPRPRGSALGRPRSAPLVVYRPVAEPRVVPLVVPLVVPPRVVPRVVPRLGAEYFDVGLEETVLGGCSTKEVSVVLGEGQLEDPGLESARRCCVNAFTGRMNQLLTRKSSRHRLVVVLRFPPLCKVF
jgi:hypothetical protein